MKIPGQFEAKINTKANNDPEPIAPPGFEKVSDPSKMPPEARPQV